MKQLLSVIVVIATALLWVLAAAPAEAARPEGTLTVAVATFGNERWLPHLYVGAEDVVLKPLWENLLNRDAKGNLIPMLAERWEVLDGGRTWKFHLRKGVRFHNGSEVTAEDVKFTFTAIAREGSANSLAGEFRQIKSMEVEGPYAISVRFEKPFVTFGNRITHGLFSSMAYIQSRKHLETAGEDGAERHPVGTGPWKFVEHVRGDRIVYEAVENHWRAVPHWKRLVFVKVPEPATRMAMLRAGSVDVIEIGGEYVARALHRLPPVLTAGTGSICFAILRYSVPRDAQRTGGTPRVPGFLVPRLARNLTQYRGQTAPLPDGGVG